MCLFFTTIADDCNLKVWTIRNYVSDIYSFGYRIYLVCLFGREWKQTVWPSLIIWNACKTKIIKSSVCIHAYAGTNMAVPSSHFPAAYWIMSVCRLFNWLGCYYFVCIHSQKSIGTFSDLIMCFAFIRLCLTLMCYNDLYLLWGRGIQRNILQFILTS